MEVQRSKSAKVLAFYIPQFNREIYLDLDIAHKYIERS